MPLIQECRYENPMKILRPIPMDLQLETLKASEAPDQGDHVFGDVRGTIKTALKHIFGDDNEWIRRMTLYNTRLATVWSGLVAADFGHNEPEDNQPIVNRQGNDKDAHGFVYGVYSARLQWTMCEIVCRGNGRLTIGGGSKESRLAWKNQVLNRFLDLMNHLIDSTAFHSYLSNPRTYRTGNPNEVSHLPMSFAEADRLVGNTGGGRPASERF
jgi:hypothetical protein